MNARTGVWLTVLTILGASAAFIFGFKGAGGNDFTINDRYIEETPQGMIAYYFVETQNVDTAYLTKIGQFIKQDYIRQSKQGAKVPMTMLLGQFYRPQDAKSLDDTQISQMRIPVDQKEKFVQRLQYVEKGYVYREFINVSPELTAQMALPEASVINSPVIVPKKGYSIKDLIPKR
ncbi:MAG TPA: hypothetical protein VEC36_08340 [Patescibacteria group bacterium]|nr:hypothetical protein [Patescibacteria group bacterium]